MILLYKQNRMEQRVEKTNQMIADRQEELNAAINNLTEDMAEQIKGKYFEMLMDYSIDEPQEEKIKYLVNGYMNVARMQNPQEDIIRSFYDTLEQMNMLDIRIFKLYTFSNNDSYYNIIEDYQLEDSHYHMVQEKLVRLGLTCSQRDAQRDENVDFILKYLEELEKGKKTKLEAKRTLRRESFKMTNYGYCFISFIESVYKGEQT